MVPGVAAGHPATAEAGLEILADGGTAADAAVAACLASCVAETVMTGLLGGGHALWWDGRSARLLDCFVTVPSRLGPMEAGRFHGWAQLMADGAKFIQKELTIQAAEQFVPSLVTGALLFLGIGYAVGDPQRRPARVDLGLHAVPLQFLAE